MEHELRIWSSFERVLQEMHTSRTLNHFWKNRRISQSVFFRVGSISSKCLRAAFTCKDPKSTKRQSSHRLKKSWPNLFCCCISADLRCYAVRPSLMKLTPVFFPSISTNDSNAVASSCIVSFCNEAFTAKDERMHLQQITLLK